MGTKWVATESGYEIKNKRAALVVQKREGDDRYEWQLLVDMVKRCDSPFLYRNAKDAKKSAIQFVRTFTADMSMFRAIKELVDEPLRPVVAGEAKAAKKPEPKKLVETSFSIKGSNLAKLLGRVVNQADVVGSTRPALSCVHLESTGRTIKSCATDDCSMATYAVECEGKKAAPFTNLLISAKDAVEIVSQAKKMGDKSCAVVAQKGKVGIGGMVYECGDYEYPNYKQVIDVYGNNAKLVVAVSVSDLRTMLDAARKVVVNKYPAGSGVSAKDIKNKTYMLLRVSSEKRKATISGKVYFRAGIIGEDVFVNKPVEIVSGAVASGGTIIGFNVARLTRGLENVSGETVLLGIENERSPMSIWDDSDKAYYGIVMPVRIDDYI